MAKNTGIIQGADERSRKRTNKSCNAEQIAGGVRWCCCGTLQLLPDRFKLYLTFFKFIYAFDYTYSRKMGVILIPEGLVDSILNCIHCFKYVFVCPMSIHVQLDVLQNVEIYTCLLKYFH